MISILDILKEYWVLIVFFIGQVGAICVFAKFILAGIKCSLRNDILDIYDRCKEKKQITHYQLESIQYSYTIYKQLKGNSFVEDIVRRVNSFELID